MRTIFDLLAPHPETSLAIRTLDLSHDVWIVGGAARALMYGLPFPSDIDVLLNNEAAPLTALASPDGKTTGSGEQGQKVDVGGVKLDIFENGIVKWLAGVPCYGDGLAIRVSDNFILTTWEFNHRSWGTVSPRYPTSVRPEYWTKHVESLQRDFAAVNWAHFRT